MDNDGPIGKDGQAPDERRGRGGKGYGAGGGAGGIGSGTQTGGAGAPGFVYIEWNQVPQSREH